MIPIVINHDTQKIIGKLFQGSVKPNEYYVSFDQPIPKSMMLNCGYEILKSESVDGKEFIRLARIHELSLDITREFVDSNQKGNR